VEKEAGTSAPEKEQNKKKISLLYHGSLLAATLVVISIIAEEFAVAIDDSIDYLQAPQALAGLITASIILTPEGLTAVRAALRNDMQRVTNIILGSSLSTVALTIPAILCVSYFTGKQVTMALPPMQLGLLSISLLIASIAQVQGETSPIEGLIELMLFVAFVFLIFI
jgi:Ca2+:H+ antiporter